MVRLFALTLFMAHACPLVGILLVVSELWRVGGCR